MINSRYLLRKICPRCRRSVPREDYSEHQRSHRRSNHHHRVGNASWRRLRERVIRRDGGKCTYPGCEETEDLEVHHVDLNSENDADENLLTRCHDHHPRQRPPRTSEPEPHTV